MIAFDQVTDVIPAQLYTHFGFTYEMSGLAPFGATNVLCVVSHPPMRTPEGKRITRHQWTSAVRADYGGTAKGFVGYTFELPSEIVPGSWIMALYLNDQLQVRKHFTVTIH